ncbi:MAG: hypothetical protein ACSHX0_05495 [Akkermansiaceae bacterium]
MKPKEVYLVIVAIFCFFTQACEKENSATSELERVNRNSKISKAGIEAMLTVGGQKYIETIGIQNAEGPYQTWGKSTSHSGSSVNFGDLTFTSPRNGRQYMVLMFRNSDGSPFMKILIHPEEDGS